MPVSASKLVTLAQLQVQAERVKQELAKYTLASELGSLAKKSEISEADLSAALKSVIDGKMDAADSMTTEAINSAIATAIAKSAHARFEKVEKVPSNDEAQDNVLYLVMNAATGYYDIYAKVGEEVVRLDDTTVDLSNYATIEQLNAVSFPGFGYQPEPIRSRTRMSRVGIDLSCLSSRNAKDIAGCHKIACDPFDRILKSE